MIYQIDAAMFGPDWELRDGATMREVASVLEQECHARGWDVEVEAVNSYNGARNYDEDGRLLEESLPAQFDDLFWDVAERFNARAEVIGE